MRSIKAFLLSLVLAATSLNTVHAGLAVRLFYPGYDGNSISTFKPFVPDFPYNFDPSPYFSLGGEDPNFTFYTNNFDSGTPVLGASYGSFFHGYIDPPQNGTYFFYIASDDDANLFLSTDETTNNLRINPICQNLGAVGYLNFDAKPAQRSAPIVLIKGKRYYYEVNFKQGGGGAHVSVGWQLPNGALERPMSTIYLQPYEEDFSGWSTRTNAIAYTAPVFATQAANGGNLGPLFVTENTSGALSVAVRGKQPMAYRWTRTGTGLLPGATNSYLIITNAKTLTNGTYSVTVSNAFGQITSVGASVTVTADTTKPSLVAASLFGRTNGLTVQFSEPVTATALTPANYTIVTTNSSVQVTVIAASFVGGDPTRVNLTVTPNFDLLGVYSMTASGITDQAASPNTITTNSIPVAILSQDNVINYARFDNIGGNTDVPSLTNNAAFTSWINSGRTTGASIQQKLAVTSLDTTANRGGNVDNYGSTMYGYLIPPMDGAYRFYLVADDNSSLYLSTDSSPANKVQIAQVTSWGNWQQWLADLGGGVVGNGATGLNGFTNFFDYGTSHHTWWSKPINLQAGHAYYFETYQKEGGGGDDMGFTWDGPPGSGIPTVANGTGGIEAKYLSTVLLSSGLPVTITNAALPADITVADFKPATFTVQADGAPNLGYQWYRSNSITGAFAPIGDAQLATYTIPFVTILADNNAYFYCVVSNGFSYATSRVAQLTITADTTPPTALSAKGHGFFTNATLRFSEAMDYVSASTATNYTIVDANNVPLTVVRATLDGTLTNVILNTGPQTPGMTYTITVSTNLFDGSSGSNHLAVATNISFRAFVLTRGFLAREFYLGPGGTLVTDLQGAANYPDFPDSLDYIANGFNSPQTSPDLNNFGVRLTGVLSVPTNTALVPSGFFYFYLQSDDSSSVYIGPDASPTSFANSASSTNAGIAIVGANTEIAALYGLPLNRGNSYFIQGLYKEGGGGDYMRLAWRDQADGNSIGGTNNNFVIPATYLSAYADPFAASVTVTNQPKDIGPLQEGTSTNLTVGATGTNFNNANPPKSYIWQTAPPGTTGNNGFADIDGQGVNGTTYQTPLLFGSDLGRRYRCIVSVPGNTTTSAVATVTNIIANTTPISIVKSVGNDGNPLMGNTATSFGLNGLTNVVVSFDRLIDPNSVLPSNFSVIQTNGTGALSVFSATVVNGTNVVLITSQQTEGAFYQVTVSPGITDLSANHNTIGTNNVSRFTGWVFSQGAITFKRWLGISTATTIASLTSDPRFPNQPSVVQLIGNFQTNTTAPNLDNLGDWVYGYFIPPTNGVYVFAISTDDNGELWLSTDSTPAHRVLLATESQWGNSQDWRTDARRGLFNGHLENQSDPVTLVAGQKYYMELFHKEGGGGDQASVAVGNNTNFSTISIPGTISALGYAAFTNNNGASTTVPGGTIPGAFMGLYANPDASAITISSQPANQSITENRITTFTVGASGQNYFTINAGVSLANTAPLIYQWQRNGTNIPGAPNSATFTFTNTMANSNDTYRVIIAMTNVYAVTNISSSATLTVTPDTAAPRLLSVTSLAFQTNILLKFDEAISAATANNPANFTITSPAGNLTVLKSSFYATNQVLLQTAVPVPGTNYTITVSGIQDLAAAGANTIVTTQKVFSSMLLVNGLIRFERFENVSGGALSGLTNSAAYIANDPTLRDATESGILYTNKAYIVQSAPVNIDNYGARLIGFFVPPTNGLYTFFERGDDGTAIYLTTNGVRTLASGRDNTANATAQSSNPPNAAGAANPPQQIFTLTGGTYYPIEMLLKEGGGGDVFEGYVTFGSNTNAPGQTGQPATGAGSTIPGSMLATYVNPDDTTLTITVQPVSQGAIVGQTRTFSVTQTNDSKTIQGGLSVSYQWYTNGIAIAGATSSSYTTPALTAADDGKVYTVAVILPEKSVLSSGATLSVVTSGPAITVQPTPSSIVTNVGATAVYNVTATGPSLTYQWYFNVTNSVAGATTSTLTLNNVQKANAGGYTVAVRNAGGAVTSSPPATLSVLVTPYSFTNMSRASGSTSSVQFNTDAGRTYQVQFTTALSVTPPTSWTTLTNVLGTGGLATVNDATATNAVRFYRIITTYP